MYNYVYNRVALLLLICCIFLDAKYFAMLKKYEPHSELLSLAAAAEADRRLWMMTERELSRSKKEKAKEKVKTDAKAQPFQAQQQEQQQGQGQQQQRGGKRERECERDRDWEWEWAVDECPRNTANQKRSPLVTQALDPLVRDLKQIPLTYTPLASRAREPAPLTKLTPRYKALLATYLGLQLSSRGARGEA